MRQGGSPTIEDAGAKGRGEEDHPFGRRSAFKRQGWHIMEHGGRGGAQARGAQKEDGRQDPWLLLLNEYYFCQLQTQSSNFKIVICKAEPCIDKISTEIWTGRIDEFFNEDGGLTRRAQKPEQKIANDSLAKALKI